MIPCLKTDSDMVLLDLLVAESEYPLSYSLYSGYVFIHHRGHRGEFCSCFVDFAHFRTVLSFWVNANLNEYQKHIG